MNRLTVAALFAAWLVGAGFAQAHRRHAFSRIDREVAGGGRAPVTDARVKATPGGDKVLGAFRETFAKVNAGQ